MLASYGHSVPLLAALGAEVLWGLLLLAPRPLSTPAVRVSQAMYSATGATISTRRVLGEW